MEHITPSIAPPFHVIQNIDDLSLRSLQSLPGSVATTAGAPPKTFIQMHTEVFKTLATTCSMATSLALRRRSKIE